MHKTCTGIKQTKKNKVWASTQGWGSIDCKILVILVFLMPVQVLWRSCFGFFSFLMPVHVWWRLESQNLHRHQQKPKKNKPLDAQNLHRHQKKQNNKNFAIYRPPALSRCSDFGFFGFSDACAGFVHLVVWFFCFFWCLCRFCEG